MKTDLISYYSFLAPKARWRTNYRVYLVTDHSYRHIAHLQHLGKKTVLQYDYYVVTLHHCCNPWVPSWWKRRVMLFLVLRKSVRGATGEKVDKEAKESFGFTTSGETRIRSLSNRGGWREEKTERTIGIGVEEGLCCDAILWQSPSGIQGTSKVASDNDILLSDKFELSQRTYECEV